MNHKYSSYLIIIFLLLGVSTYAFGIMSDDVDEICSTPGSVLYRTPVNWTCALLNALQFNITNTTINNITININITSDTTLQGNLTVTGHVNASKFYGDGSHLTGLQHGTLLLYFHKENNTDLTSDQILSSTYPGEAQEEYTYTITSSELNIMNFTSQNNTPGIALIQEGAIHFHIHAKKTAGTKDARIKFNLTKIALNGVEENIGLSEQSEIIPNVNEHLDIHLLLNDTKINTTDRLKLRLIADQEGAGTDPQIKIYVEGSTSTRMELPTGAINIENFVPYTGAVSDVTLGTHTLTAENVTTTNTLTYNYGNQYHWIYDEGSAHTTGGICLSNETTIQNSLMCISDEQGNNDFIYIFPQSARGGEMYVGANFMINNVDDYANIQGVGNISFSDAGGRGGIELAATDHQYLWYAGFPNTGWYADITNSKQSLRLSTEAIINFTLTGNIEGKGVIQMGDVASPENYFGGNVVIGNDKVLKTDTIEDDDAGFITMNDRITSITPGTVFGSTYDSECTFKANDWCFISLERVVNKIAQTDWGNRTYYMGDMWVSDINTKNNFNQSSSNALVHFEANNVDFEHNITVENISILDEICFGTECRTNWPTSTNIWNSHYEFFDVDTLPLGNRLQQADNQVLGGAGLPIGQNCTIRSISYSVNTAGTCTVSQMCYIRTRTHEGSTTDHETTNITIPGGNYTSYNSGGYTTVNQTGWEPLQIIRGESMHMMCNNQRTCGVNPAEFVFRVEAECNSSTSER